MGICMDADTTPNLCEPTDIEPHMDDQQPAFADCRHRTLYDYSKESVLRDMRSFDFLTPLKI